MKALQYLRQLDVPIKYDPSSPTDFLTEEEWDYLGKDVAMYVTVFMQSESLQNSKRLCIRKGPEEKQTTFLMEMPDFPTKEKIVVGFTIERVSESPARWKLVNVTPLKEFSTGNAVKLLWESAEKWLERSGVAFSVFWEDSEGERDCMADYAFDGCHASQKAELYVPEGGERLGKILMSQHETVPSAIAFAFALNKANGKEKRWDLPDEDAG